MTVPVPVVSISPHARPSPLELAVPLLLSPSSRSARRRRHPRPPHTPPRPTRCASYVAVRWARLFSFVCLRSRQPSAVPSRPEAPAGPGDDSCYRRRAVALGDTCRGEARVQSYFEGCTRSLLTCSGARCPRRGFSWHRPRRHLSPTSCESVMARAPDEEKSARAEGDSDLTCLT